MCGITGWIDYKTNLLNKQDTIQMMTETLSKRGPDDTNIWLTRNAAFGHKRLVVVDPLCGVQPMSRKKEDYTYTLCYNGELYNTEDIRKELLSKGYRFQGHSDTEVLLSAYMEWEEECIHYFNGIFAFAIWDEKKQQLFAARDRLGVKPLFYREHNGGLLFGSELKAILAHPEVKPELGRDGLSEIFGLGPSKTPGHGIFQGINELRPAFALTFSKNGMRQWRYWNVKSERHLDSLEETAEKINYLFKDAVTRQLVSDVPICTFLSGGVDSSAITAIAANHFEENNEGPLHTFSIDYEGNDQYFKANEFQPNADSYWIEKMTQSFGTIHHSSIIGQEELAEYLKEAVLVRDTPGMADVDSSLLWFCKEIKKDFVVSLSGECADEIFGGYPWFYREEDLARNGFPWMRSIDERVGLLKDGWSKKLNIEDYVLTKYEETVQETPILEGESLLEAKRRQLFYLNMIWFMTTLLDRKDRMSMGASLEVRVPFADHRLVEYVWNIPWEMKMYGNREKGLLRKALENILPTEVLYRKKSPYPKTHHPVYTKVVKQWLNDILEDKNSILYEMLKADRLKEIVETEGRAFQVPWFGQLMTGPQLLAYLAQIHYWFDEYGINIKE
ncbi:asparagine synthase (glutamine-hydrolyzing) [Heyndrickxia oleronia]|uniref:asparagine synthase (glutamine-hydrolyzing) n=1 Tax=Heyndrickxia oleronia TaxID=38875 RepID=A0AAW6T060_9BACI|nr:asparagine synthase (glutamine-hydrolyzing) [Heyndrickxia oleronia]MDH5162932.1 asparagine synthase (glutamine-hydrolyzing) [Heyndrickxia oleronia]